ALRPRQDDAAHRAAEHHVADRDRPRVARAIAHPTAHVRIDRQPEVLDERLTRARFRHGPRLETETLVGGLACGARREDDYAVVGHGHGSTSTYISSARIVIPAVRR